MQPWFSDAKLGIFIHYGIYAVDGVPESWSFYSGKVPHEQYMKQLDGFTASNYDPKAWAEVFAKKPARSTRCSPPGTMTGWLCGTPGRVI